MKVSKLRGSGLVMFFVAAFFLILVLKSKETLTKAYGPDYRINWDYKAGITEGMGANYTPLKWHSDIPELDLHGFYVEKARELLIRCLILVNNSRSNQFQVEYQLLFADRLL